MGTISLQIPQVGQPDTTEDVKVQNNFTTLQTVINGGLDTNNLSASAGIGAAQLAVGAARLQVRTVAAAATAVAGQLILCTGTGPYTITLPSPAANASVGVVAFTSNASGANPVQVSTGGAQLIFAPALQSTALFLGAISSFVILHSDGTNWYLVGGQADTGWVAITLGSNITATSGYYAPSARLEGDVVRLKGGLSPAAAIAAGATVATMPAGMSPSGTVRLGGWESSGGVIQALLQVSSAGVATFQGLTAVNWSTGILPLDGLTYTLS